MKILAILLSITITTISLQAQDSDPREIEVLENLAEEVDRYEMPVDLQVYKTGYPESPVIPCPEPKKKYLDMLSNLGSIKQKIKDDTCQDTKVKAINEEVASLESLLTDKRKGFIDTVTKGVSKNEQLTQKEVEAVQTYIDQVVKKAAHVTGLVKNAGCFDEDAQVSTLSTLSALVADVTGAIGALSGPFGVKVALGGKLASGLLTSIDTIVQAKKTYEYDNFEDRKNYLNNLCTYYAFKNDLDKETNSFAYFDKLYNLLDRTTLLQTRLSERCDDCVAIINDYRSKEIDDGRSIFEMSQPSLAPMFVPANEFGQINSEYAHTAKAPSFDEKHVSYIAAEDMTEYQLLKYYATSGVIDEEADLDDRVIINETVLAEPVIGEELLSSVSSVLYDDRRLTIHSLQIQSWLEKEINTLKELDNEWLSADGRREVMRVQEQIEKFLVGHEGQRYIEYYTDLLLKDFRNLTRLTEQARRLFLQYQVLPDGKYGYNNSKNFTTIAIHDLFRSQHEFGPIQHRDWAQKALDKVLREYRPKILDALEPVRIDFHILSQRCAFFKNSQFNNGNAEVMANKCAWMERKRKNVIAFFQEMKNTDISFTRKYGDFVSFASEEPKDYSADWLDSTYKVFGQRLNNL